MCLLRGTSRMLAMSWQCAATQPPGNSPCSCSLTSSMRLSPTRNFFPTVTAPFRNKELYYVARGEPIGFHPVHILVQLTSNCSPDSITKVTIISYCRLQQVSVLRKYEYLPYPGIFLSVSVGLSDLLPSVCNKWRPTLFMNNCPTRCNHE